ncbi:MAG: radical SAM protein [Candidatus Omnitrophota bacterium]|nr:radical SAM protein [Candidatus Omnitrophota bacterium]
MRILFIQKDIFESYGVMLLTAVLRKEGHRVKVLVDAIEPDIMSKIRKEEPDVIAFSVTSARYSWLKGIASEIKHFSKAKIVVGGPHPTFFPELINEDFVDIICMGEGEVALSELAKRLEAGADISDIKNLHVKENGAIYKNEVGNLIEDLDSLPYAARDAYDAYPLFGMQGTSIMLSGRGCPYRCAFCFNKKYNELYKGKGKLIRKRTVSNLIKEMKLILEEKKHVNYFLFHDDTFIVGSPQWVDEFCVEYKKYISKPFGINARADLINEDIIEKLKTAGCSSVRIGIENANPYIRETLLKKGITNEEILNAAKVIKKYKIKLQLFNILGSPGETVDTALETYEMSRQIHPEHAWCSLLAPYPGTEIAELSLEKGLLPKGYNFSSLENSYFDSIPLSMENKNQIINLQKLFQAGNLLRIPTSLMRLVIKLPPNTLFEQIFKINYALAVKRMDNLSLQYLIKAASFSKDYIKRRTGHGPDKIAE